MKARRLGSTTRQKSTVDRSAFFSVIPVLKKKSRTPKPGVWLMRGAQPATSAGARLFAGSPIPALLPSSMGRYRDQKTRVVISSCASLKRSFACNEHSSPTWFLGLHAKIQLERLLSRFLCAAVRGVVAIRVRVWEGLR